MLGWNRASSLIIPRKALLTWPISNRQDNNMLRIPNKRAMVIGSLHYLVSVCCHCSFFCCTNFYYYRSCVVISCVFIYCPLISLLLV
ncbi:hypothetical protein F5Y12DRAFT_548585 [Xylaria sp. FL1777]|nr:hypothetical protein F5Y12DRAFT_548585 [Xylaria sp. FL1777]